MKTYYQLTGLTCEGCIAKVKYYLSEAPGVESIEVTLRAVEIGGDTSYEALRLALVPAGERYQILENVAPVVLAPVVVPKSWLATYRPLLLVFGYILLVSFLAQADDLAHFDFMLWMRHFMAGFFLVFSFFKMLDIRNFADSFKMYDIPAARIPGYALAYPFIELGLGISYLLNFMPVATNVVALVIMGVGAVGVLRSVLNKSKIRCACLGSVFELPMSTVTLVEDMLMVVMAAGMLLMG